MGARTNYTIITTDNPLQNINVYSHWDGGYGLDLMKNAVAKAMPRIEMNDVAYAARIIIDQLTEGGRDEETGYGIYIGPEVYYEEEYEYKEIDLMNNTITYGQMEMTIDDFVKVGV